MKLNKAISELFKQGIESTHIESIVETSTGFEINMCDSYGNSDINNPYVIKKGILKKIKYESLEIPKEYQSFRYEVTEALLNDADIQLIINHNNKILYESIKLLYNKKYTPKLYEMYSIFGYVTYIVKTFYDGINSGNFNDAMNNHIIAEFVNLSLEEQLEQSLKFTYKPDFIKEFLKLTNTILIMADKKMYGDTSDKDLYIKCKDLIKSQINDIDDKVDTENSRLLYKKYWVDTVRMLKEQVETEIGYIDGLHESPSERMKQYKGISRATNLGTTKQFSWAQSFID